MRINVVRRIFAILILTLFIFGNLGIVGVLKGDLSSSIIFSFMPLSDPYAVLQVYLASGTIALNAVIVIVAYILVLLLHLGRFVRGYVL